MGRKCLRKSFQMGRLLWRGKFTCSKLLCFYMNTRILISSCLWSIGQQMRRWRHHKKILLFYYIKKWRVCTVKDHRRRQNVVRASVILDQLYLLSFFLFFFLPHFVVICHLLLNRCAASLNPFVNVIRFELSLSCQFLRKYQWSTLYNLTGAGFVGVPEPWPSGHLLVHSIHNTRFHSMTYTLTLRIC